MSSVMIFCKVPRPGEVKTRLCPPLSPGEAASLARAFLQDLVGSLAELPGFRLEVALPPGATPGDFAFLDRDLAFVEQGPGDLGKRLARATTAALERHGAPAAVVGGDHPNLPLNLVTEMVENAHEGQVGWIPTEDGGFAALALAEPAPGLFAGVPWSSPDAAAAVRRNARRDGLALVDHGPWYDVDEGPDLVRLVRDLDASDGCPATRRALASLRPPLSERNAGIPRRERE